MIENYPIDLKIKKYVNLLNIGTYLMQLILIDIKRYSYKRRIINHIFLLA